MSTQSKPYPYQKHDKVKIHESLSFANQKSKYTTFFPSKKPVFTVISSYLTGSAIDCIQVKVFYAERKNYLDRLNIPNASIDVLDNKRTVGSLWYILSSKQVDKTDVIVTIQGRC